MRDEDHIGPYNGHNKSEALPNGCFMVVLAAIAFIAIFGAYGFYADWRKSTAPTPDQLYGCTIKQQMPNGDCP